LLGQGAEQVAAGLFGPVGARLDQAAGGDDADLHIGAHDDEAVIALGRRKLDVGDLLGLNAAAQADGGGT
jgi:hypothetical protein